MKKDKLQLNKETLLSTILQLKYKHFVTEKFHGTEKPLLYIFCQSICQVKNRNATKWK